MDSYLALTTKKTTPRFSSSGLQEFGHRKDSLRVGEWTFTNWQSQHVTIWEDTQITGTTIIERLTLQMT